MFLSFFVRRNMHLLFHVENQVMTTTTQPETPMRMAFPGSLFWSQVQSDKDGSED